MMSAMMLVLLCLPGEEQPGFQAGDTPSLELLEYLGAMEEDGNGELPPPLELPQPASTTAPSLQPAPPIEESSQP